MSETRTIGWREWVHLPDLGEASIKAKIDTGARTSAIHAFEVAETERDGIRWVDFVLHPEQRSSRFEITASARLVEHRPVRSSNGSVEMRPVISTTLQLDGELLPIELTLSQRDQMGFRMLIGRSALKGRFNVDPSRSYRGAESRAVRRALRRRKRRRPAEVAEAAR